MTKAETKFISFIQKHIVAIGFIAVSIMAFILRIVMYDVELADYSFFMKSWIEQLNEAGGLKGLGENIGEYNVPYMLFLAIVGQTPMNDLYEIKSLSLIFDFVMAFAAIRLISYLRDTKLFTAENLLAYAALLIFPVFFLNTAAWAQCDSIYVSMLVLCTYNLLKEKHIASMVFFGIAFSLKLQAVFFLPVLIIYYFASKKMSALHFLIIPGVYLIGILPAVIAGRSFTDALLIYVKQTSIYELLTMECPNIFVFLLGDYHIYKNVGIVLTLLILGLGACIMIYQKRHSSKDIVLLSAWSAMVCIYFLPSMHERYAYLACVLSIVWAFVYHKDWWIALGVNVVCMLSYISYLYKTEVIEIKYLAIVNLILLVYMSIRLFKRNHYDKIEPVTVK